MVLHCSAYCKCPAQACIHASNSCSASLNVSLSSKDGHTPEAPLKEPCLKEEPTPKAAAAADTVSAMGGTVWCEKLAWRGVALGVPIGLEGTDLLAGIGL